MPQEKIRPPTHSSLKQSDPELRAEGERGLPDRVVAADPGARLQPGEEAIDACAPSPPIGWPAAPPGAFTAVQAAEHRAGHGGRNRLGKPDGLSDAEALLVDYQRKLQEYRDDYAGTRSEAKRIPFLEAKQKMIDAGLMKGDV